MIKNSFNCCRFYNVVILFVDGFWDSIIFLLGGKDEWMIRINVNDVNDLN